MAAYRLCSGGTSSTHGQTLAAGLVLFPLAMMRIFMMTFSSDSQ
jgi:hypothetical protein